MYFAFVLRINMFLTSAWLIDNFIKHYQAIYFIYKLMAARQSCKKAPIHFLPNPEVVHRNFDNFN